MCRIVITVPMSRPAGAGDLLRTRCDDLVAADLARLARRVPVLDGENLGRVETALRQLIDGLVLSRARAIGGEELAMLFDLGDEP